MKPHDSRRLLVAFACCALVAAVTGCDDTPNKLVELTGGDPHKGKVAIYHYGCGSCHTIPGIRDADALVGPPLTKMGGRLYIGGVLNNTPENMLKWLRDPPAVDPKTAMPNVHLSDADVRDVAAYLYTLK